MKKIIYLFAAVALMACSSQKSASSTSSTSSKTTETETVEKEMEDRTLNKDASGNLTGVHTIWAFQQAPYSSWFTPKYESYTPDQSIVNSLKEEMDGVTVRAYMGTWCGDSKRETPQFYKLMDKVGFDYDDLTMITVDRTKKQPVELVSGYNVIRVPTFIFYKNGSEIGRYVERPRESLAQDILKIVSGQEYKHYYDRS